MSDSIVIQQVSNGFIVKPLLHPYQADVALQEVNVFNDHYDLYQYILTHFKLKSEEAKNE